MNIPKVIIEIRGGVAIVTHKDRDVMVELVDYDNDEDAWNPTIYDETDIVRNGEDTLKDVSKKNRLFSRTIWSTSFSFEDIYDCADNEFQDRVDKMSEEEFGKFYDENEHAWLKSFESGIMNNWSEVANILASDSKFPEEGK